MCVYTYVYVPVDVCFLHVHVFPSVMNTCLCVLRYSCVSSLVFFLSPVRSFLPHFFFLSFLLVSRSHSILFLTTFLSVNLFHFLPLSISHVLTFHALSFSFSLFLFSLTDSKNHFLLTFFRRNSVFQFSFDPRCPRCESFRNEKLIGHAWKNTWKDWWKNYSYMGSA